MSTPNAALKPAIVISATFTAEPILPGLRCVLQQAALAFDVRFSPYNQVFQELLGRTSLLGTNKSGVDVVIVRIEDFVRQIVDLAEARPLIERTVDQLWNALTGHAHRAKVPTVLAVLRPSPGANKELVAELEAATTDLTARAISSPDITLLSQDDIDRVSTGQSYDALSDSLAHIPYSEEYYASLALAIARKVHALCVPAHKVLVLDCDNTLWRGVVGEDGVDGISIPPALVRIQRFAADAQARGVLICLASKNSESDVLEVFEKRLDMILRKEQIVAYQINWGQKPSNIVSLARFLNLGLDSFVFLDDNPVECELMRAELPEVVTLQVPPDDEVESFLNHLWTFDKVAITEEDARRTKMYRENAARQELEKSTADIAEFIASLKVVVDIAVPEDGEWPRVAQLTQRTNQFNFTTVRRTEPDVRHLSVDGSTVLRVKVRDRFGDYGLVGILIANRDAESLAVDTLLLSCRVLGRGVEHTMMRRLGEIAKERGLAYVDLLYARTSKNEPARAFAESVAAEFRDEQGAQIVYRIPADEACKISHRPGHDPAAVIDALKAEESKATSSPKAKAKTPSADNWSQLYTNLASTLISGRDVLRIARSGNVRERTLPNEPQKPATEIEARLLRLWEEILGIVGLGVEDDYFALGGTSLIAARMFAEISRQFGVKLPLTTILEAPTVRSLSHHLTPISVEHSWELVELKGGGVRNLFFVHDGDGETLLYFNLARRMPSDLAVYGIEPRRLTSIPLAHARIEDMAAFYVEQLRRKQPQGPYRIGGMCAGGVIAYEMASQLIRTGDEVELVVLLDAATPQAPKQRGRMTKQRLQRMTNALADARSTDRSRFERALLVVYAVSRKIVTASTWEIKQRFAQWSIQARFGLLREVLARERSWPRFVPELSLRQIYDTAERHYVPAPLSGALVLLIRARAGQGGDTPYREIYADETLGWGKLTNNLAVLDADGGHSSMLQEPFVDGLADALMGYLVDQSADVRPPSPEAETRQYRTVDEVKDFVTHP
jgi:FkbH-like protein